MTRLALALLLTLAGCTDTRSPDEISCASQAENDPTVREMIRKGAGNPYLQREGFEARRAAEQDATLACLRNRGLIRRGGVERQKPF